MRLSLLFFLLVNPSKDCFLKNLNRKSHLKNYMYICIELDKKNKTQNDTVFLFGWPHYS